MADRIARFDWATTALGPREAWPQSLRTAVDLVLALPQPGYIGWGPTLASIYNDAAVPIFGHRHPDALGRHLFDVWHELAEPYRAVLDRVLSGESLLFVDQPMQLAGEHGEPRCFTFSWTPLRDDDGRIAGFLTVGLDTTEKVRSEQLLQESESLARTLLGALAQAAWETGPDGLVSVDSPSWRAYTGQTVDESMGWGWLDAIHPDDQDYARLQWAEAVAARRPVDAEFRIRRAPGGWCWTNVRAMPLLDRDGHVRKWVGMNIDVNARHTADDALRDSQARLARELDGARLLQSLSSGLVAGDGGAALHQRVVDAAAALMRSHGASLQRFDAGAATLELIASRGFDAPARAYWQRVDVGHASTCGDALRTRTRSIVDDVATSSMLAGTPDLVHYTRLGYRAMQSTPLRARDGRPLGMLTTHWTEPHTPGEDALRRFDVLVRMAADLLERDDAAARLARSEQLLQAALEAADVGTWVWYPERDASDCDLRTCELFGYPGGTSIGYEQIVAERLHPDDVPAHRAAIARSLDPRGGGRLESEFRIRLPDGSERWIQLLGRARPSREPGTTEMTGTTVDITARKRREADLAFLAEFERRLAAHTDPEEIARAAAAAVAEHFGTTHNLLVDIDPDLDIAHVYWDHARPGADDLRGAYHLPDFHTADELAGLHAGTPVALSDVRIDCDPERAEGFEHYGIRALATLPCVRDGRWIFALSVQHDTPHAWDAAELDLLLQLVERLWLRLERARTDAARREHDAQQAFLLALSDRLRPLDDPAEIQATATRVLRERLDVGWCYYTEFDEAQRIGTVHDDAVRPGLPSLAGAHPTDHFPEYMRAVGRGAVVAVPDIRTSPLLTPPVVQKYLQIGFESVVAAPLVKNGRAVALFALAETRPRDWPEATQRLLVEVAERTWAAIERARAEAALARQTRFIEGMLGSLPDYAYAFDRDHRFVYTNRVMQALFGRDAAGMAGRNFADLNYPPDLAAHLDVQIEHIFATGETVEDEVFYTSPTGVAAYFAYLWGPVYDADGRVELVVGTSRDTTERRRMEERLRADEARQAFLLRLADAVRDLDDPLRIQQEAMRRVAEHTGADRVLFGEYDGDDVVVTAEHLADGMPSIAGRYPATAFGRVLKPAFRDGQVVIVRDIRQDERFDARDRRRYAQAGIASLVGAGVVQDGQVVVAFGAHARRPRDWSDDDADLMREVAERVWTAVQRARAEQALRRSEERFAMLAHSIDDVFYMTDVVEGRLLYLSPGFERIWGVSGDALREDLSTFATTLHPDDQDAHAEAKARQRNGESLDTEYRIVRPDGEMRWISDRCFPVPGSDGRLSAGIARDITERKAMEAAREASEQLLRQFSEASADVLWIRDAETLRWEYLSPAYAQVYGEPVEAALDVGDVHHWTEQVLEDDRAHAIASMDRVRAGEQVTFEYRIRRVDDGAVRWVRDTDFPILDTDGHVQRIGGIGHDVTDLKRAEAALADSEHRLRALMEGIPQLVWRSLEGGDWTWSSPQWQDFTGQTCAQSLRMGWLDAVHPDDRAAALAAWDRARQTAMLDVELRLRRAADEAWIWHHTRSLPQPRSDDAVVEWFGTCTDVHELKALQEQQQVLVAELQHRTRNLISVVRSIADRTMAGSASMDQFRARFRDHMAALARVQGLLSQRDAGQRVSFDQLLNAELGGLGVLDRDAQLALEGPAGVTLRSSSVQTFALALHELATNAVKYGALSGAAGRLDVRWRVEEDGEGVQRLCVDWQESGVDVPDAKLAPTARRGYGRELIERALPYQLQAETQYALTREGVHCTIRVPLSRARLGAPHGP